MKFGELIMKEFFGDNDINAIYDDIKKLHQEIKNYRDEVLVQSKDELSVARSFKNEFYLSVCERFKTIEMKLEWPLDLQIKKVHECGERIKNIEDRINKFPKPLDGCYACAGIGDIHSQCLGKEDEPKLSSNLNLCVPCPQCGDANPWTCKCSIIKVQTEPEKPKSRLAQMVHDSIKVHREEQAKKVTDERVKCNKCNGNPHIECFCRDDNNLSCDSFGNINMQRVEMPEWYKYDNKSIELDGEIYIEGCGDSEGTFVIHCADCTGLESFMRKSQFQQLINDMQQLVDES